MKTEKVIFLGYTATQLAGTNAQIRAQKSGPRSYPLILCYMSDEPGRAGGQQGPLPSEMAGAGRRGRDKEPCSPPG